MNNSTVALNQGAYLPTRQALLEALKSLQVLSTDERRGLAFAILLNPDHSWNPNPHALHLLYEQAFEFSQQDPLGGQLLTLHSSSENLKEKE